MLIATFLSVLPTLEPGPANAPHDADVSEPAIASPMEPGSLPLAGIGVRAGFGLGNGPVGLGAQAAVGLGGVDVLLDASGFEFCLFGSCDAIVLLGGGVQANLISSGRFRIGARAQADAIVAGDSGAAFSGGVAASWGNSSTRASLGVAVLGDYNPEVTVPDRLTTWGAGPELTASYLAGHIGVGASLGYAVSIANEGYAGPMFSLTLLGRS